jgi:large subunit ribosomal protein L6e|tara:strand:+ start:81 stop:557 length:477 start_codon:yes stop_codon:yes gene_type:complete
MAIMSTAIPRAGLSLPRALPSCHTQLFIVARLDTMVKVTSIEQALKGTLSKGKTAPKKASKTPSFYPADDAKFPLKRAAVVKNQTKLRASITPGTILILLAGHFKGKRVIFLRQLDSGLLLVCGPYGVNGVPVKRVNQCYVIATSTKIDVAGVRVVFP